MAPIVQSGHGLDKDKSIKKPGDRRSELVCRVKYCNTLPDIPFDAKFITYPFENQRFVSYNPTSLERNHRFELLTEHDLGVTIDLINPDTYAIDPNAVLKPSDEKLLEEDTLAPQDSKRSRHHAKSVSWLRRTEYISTEHTRFQPQTIEKVEAKVGYNIKKMFKEENIYMDKVSQIAAINKTFDEANKPITKHYAKANVVPVDVLPIFPDFDLWKYPCAQVIFDSDPALAGVPVAVQLELMSQAMIRGVMDASGEQFVAYFLPTQETLEKRKRDVENGVEYVDEDEYDYKMAREYNWNVKHKTAQGYEENFFFVIKPEGVYYNELETRVRLSKRRLKPGAQPNNSRLIVQHRPLTAQEFKLQLHREKQLEPIADEDEEAEDNNKMETEEEAEEAEEVTQEKQNGREEGSESEDSDKGSKESNSAASSRSSSPSKSGSASPAASPAASRSSRSRSASPEKQSSDESESGSEDSSSGEEDSGSDNEKVRKKRDEEEIFGSDSD